MTALCQLLSASTLLNRDLPFSWLCKLAICFFSFIHAIKKSGESLHEKPIFTSNWDNLKQFKSENIGNSSSNCALVRFICTHYKFTAFLFCELSFIVFGISRWNKSEGTAPKQPNKTLSLAFARLPFIFLWCFFNINVLFGC